MTHLIIPSYVKPTPNETVLRLLVIGVCVVVLGPLWLVITAWLVRYGRERQDWKMWLLYAILGGLVGVYMITLSPYLVEHAAAFLRGVVMAINQQDTAGVGRALAVFLIPLWLLCLPLTPLGALFWELWRKLEKLSGNKTVEELVESGRRAEAAYEVAQRSGVQKALSGEITSTPNVIKLGPYYVGKTDTFHPDLGVLKHGSWLALQDGVLNHHLFLIGVTGAGKTQTLLRLVAEILANSDRDVFVVDGKGEGEFAQNVRALAFTYGRGEAPIFRLGQDEKGSQYNGFVGQSDAVYNRLLALAGVAQAKDNAEFYADINRVLLYCVCFNSDGPPRSFDQALDRLDIHRLRHAFAQHKHLGDWLAPKDREVNVQDLKTRLLPYALALEGSVNEHGFSLDSRRAVIFSIRTQSVGDTAKRFLPFLIEDLKDFIGKPSRQQRPAVLVIDEFGMFGAQNIVDILALARSAKLGVILATQEIASLGSEETKIQILTNTGTKLLMRSEFPEDIAQLAGTIYQIESSLRSNEQGFTGERGDRIQHAFKIDMNEAGRLKAGEAFLIRHRHAAKVAINQLSATTLERLRQQAPVETVVPESTPPTAVEQPTPPQRNIQM